MCRTYFIRVLFVLSVFFNGSHGADNSKIFLMVTRNGTRKLYENDMDIHYKVNDTVEFVCSVSLKLYGSAGYQLTLYDGVHTQYTTNHQIVKLMILQESDDGVELLCSVKSNKLDGPLTISANLKMIKTGSGFLKPNVFKIILWVLGAAVGLSIVILFFYSIVKCLKKKKSDEENIQEDISLDTQEMKYAEIDKKTKKLKNEEPQYTKIGWINVSCDVTDETVKTDSAENQKCDTPNEVIKKTDTPAIETEKRKSSIIPDTQHSQLDAKNADTIRQLVAKFDRHGSSDC